MNLVQFMREFKLNELQVILLARSALLRRERQKMYRFRRMELFPEKVRAERDRAYARRLAKKEQK